MRRALGKGVEIASRPLPCPLDDCLCSGGRSRCAVVAARTAVVAGERVAAVARADARATERPVAAVRTARSRHTGADARRGVVSHAGPAAEACVTLERVAAAGAVLEPAVLAGELRLGHAAEAAPAVAGEAAELGVAACLCPISARRAAPV